MTSEELQRENEALRRRLAEAEDALAAIRAGDVDAIVVDGADGPHVFSLAGAETVYRLAVETMAEAALNVTPEGTILFCNARFGQFVANPIERLIGREVCEFVREEDRTGFRALLEACLHHPVQSRVVFCGPGGVRTPVRLTGSALRHADGVSLCLVAADLTELEDAAHQVEELTRAQTELREARRAALGIMRAANAGSWDWNIRTGEVLWSPENYVLHDLGASSGKLPDGCGNRACIPGIWHARGR